jgi:hypothetical protein
VEAGIMTTQKDLEYLKIGKNHETIARNILDGIEKYALQFSSSSANKTIQKHGSDSIPQYYKGKKIKQAYGSNKVNKAVILYEDGTRDTIQISEAEKLRIIPPPPMAVTEKVMINGVSKDSSIKLKNTANALIVLDGVVISRDKNDLNAVPPNSIQSISVLKGETAIKKYGDKGKDGVIEIITKTTKTSTNVKPPSSDSINLNGTVTGSSEVTIIKFDKIANDNNKVFTKVEVEPSFPGGDIAWTRYVTKIIQNNIDELAKENKSGTCRVRFIVSVDGTLSNVEALTMKGTKLGELSVGAIRKGPKWNPAMQNGHKVNAYREQPITFTIQPN